MFFSFHLLVRRYFVVLFANISFVISCEFVFVLLGFRGMTAFMSVLSDVGLWDWGIMAFMSVLSDIGLSDWGTVAEVVMHGCSSVICGCSLSDSGSTIMGAGLWIVGNRYS